ncbi:hypothetical protein [Streptomyces sp. CBMA123]|uniref:hypothetical protein n=1 Tax=Streptomyces sp. CBMA123 TaxID=1896313 RepID=UPI0016618E63|nr:hypothetical protein [Streptomyces sp. CBMA123]MBD0695037.1 hypothetical protein [Streptomyces sp. CBMA123]
MVSFKELHEADFSGVSDAAEAWAGVAKALTALDGRVTKDLTSTAQRAGWKGDAADSGTKALQGIDGDFKQASAVATALAAIMKTAAEDFAAARRDLDTALHDAQTQGLAVSADGTVSWTLPKDARNDTDGEVLARDLAAKSQAISDRLGKAVEKATAADQRATLHLQSDIGTSTVLFNPAPGGTGPIADARRVQDLISKAYDLSDDELKQLQALLAANAENKEFATTLLTGLRCNGQTGPEAFLDYSKILGDLAHASHNAKGYQDIYGSMAVVLATGTRGDGMGKEWEDGLFRAARGPGGPNDTYPALTTLMETKGTFDKAFVRRVGTDLLDYEADNKLKGMDLWGPAFYEDPRKGDPLAPLLRMMKGDRDTTQAFLDPSQNKNLVHLLKDRGWLDEELERKLPADVLRDTSHKLFADILEDATIGHGPDRNQHPAPHDQVSQRIMDETLKTLGGSTPDDRTSVAAVLRKPVARMLADYSPDVYQILGNDLQSPSQPNGLTAKPEQLLRVVRGALEDPDTFKIMHEAQTEEIARRLDAFGPDQFKPDATGRPDHTLSAFSQQSAKVLGGLDAAFVNAATDHADAKNSAIDWQQRMLYHAIGTPVNLAPDFLMPGVSKVLPLGDAAQRLVDIGTASWAEQAKAPINSATAASVSDRYSAGRSELDAMIVGKASQYGIAPSDAGHAGTVTNHLLLEAGPFYNTGIDNAYHAAFGKG